VTEGSFAGCARFTHRPIARSIHMLDVVMIALALVSFALSVGYTTHT
jgi:hypothetical protein